MNEPSPQPAAEEPSSTAWQVVRQSLSGIHRRPIEVLPNPVDCDLFVPRPETVVGGRIVFAGTITEKKGVRELCHAVARLVDDEPDARLVLAGRDGTEGPGFRDAVLGELPGRARDRIEFVGALGRQELADLFATAHLCAFPSYMETQGIVVGEALAAGRPAIASTDGPGPETLGDPPCGWLVPPRSVEALERALRTALSDRELCDRLVVEFRCSFFCGP